VVVGGTNQTPRASFSVSPASPQAGQAVTFTDTSSDPDGTIASRAWDLDGDGQYNEGTGATATRSFAAAGTYTVRLRVTDNQGAQAVASQSVVVGAAGGAGNLVRNPSFETDLSGWGSWQGTLSRVALSGAPDGAWVARAARATGTSYTLDDGPDTVSATQAGALYSASVWAAAANAATVGKPLYLRVRERTPAGALVRQWEAQVALTTAFKRLSVSATAQAAGNTLDVRLSQDAAVSGNAFYADAFTLIKS
jgi:PKD repeat protein